MQNAFSLPGVFSVIVGLGLLMSLGCAARVVTVDQAGTQASGEMRNDQQTGMWQYFYEDGSLQASGPWRRDQRHGSWQYFHPDGSLKASGAYHNGLRQGWWRHYHAGDQQVVASEGGLQADRQNGLWLYRHDDGEIAGVGVFADGARVMAWQRFTSQGAPTDAVIMHRGSRVSPAADSQGIWQHSDDEGWIAGNDQGLVMAQDRSGSWLQQMSDPHTVMVLRLDGDDRLSDVWRLADGRLYHAAEAEGIDLLEAEELIARGLALRQQIEGQSSADEPLPLAPLLVWPDLDLDLSPAPSVGLGGLSVREEERLRMAQAVYSGEGSFAYAPRPSMPGRRTYGSSPSQAPRDHGLLGQVLPQRRFIQADGSVLDLSRREGTQLIVILRGFAGNICPYCGGQSKALLQHQAEIAQQGAELTFIYPGPSQSLPEFLRAVRSLDDQPLPPFTVALDVDLQLVQALDIGAELALPTSLLLDEDGVIRYAYVGQDLMDRPTIPDILAALAQMSEAD